MLIWVRVCASGTLNFHCRRTNPVCVNKTIFFKKYIKILIKLKLECSIFLPFFFFVISQIFNSTDQASVCGRKYLHLNSTPLWLSLPLPPPPPSLPLLSPLPILQSLLLLQSNFRIRSFPSNNGHQTVRL